jgi:hypothetical protein
MVFGCAVVLALIAVYTHRKLKPVEVPAVEDGNANEKV